jgi:hypothetical protein
MGDTCTRGCRFCSVKTSRTPPPLDVMEPENTAEAISRWGLGYIVLTSVDRDGAPSSMRFKSSFHVVEQVFSFRRLQICSTAARPTSPRPSSRSSRSWFYPVRARFCTSLISLMTPTFFQGSPYPRRGAHRRLQRRVGRYHPGRALRARCLRSQPRDGRAADAVGPGPASKVPAVTRGPPPGQRGLGWPACYQDEPDARRWRAGGGAPPDAQGCASSCHCLQVVCLVPRADPLCHAAPPADLRANDVDVVTFGQYMRPSKKHMKVDRYVDPSEFERWKKTAEEMGFLYVASGPLVRSSYKAGEFFISNVLNKRREVRFRSAFEAEGPAADRRIRLSNRRLASRSSRPFTRRPPLTSSCSLPLSSPSSSSPSLFFRSRSHVPLRFSHSHDNKASDCACGAARMDGRGPLARALPSARAAVPREQSFMAAGATLQPLIKTSFRLEG